VNVNEILPAAIKVGASQYVVKTEPDIWRTAHGVDGMVDFNNLSLHIVTEGRPLSDIFNTINHELLHVCYREWHIKARCGEERTVTALGFALSAVYAQNPQILEALQLIAEELTNE